MLIYLVMMGWPVLKKNTNCELHRVLRIALICAGGALRTTPTEVINVLLNLLSEEIMRICSEKTAESV